VASALATEIIGIHAIFGAFLAGAIMPETGGFRHKLSVRIENFSSVLLLPLFFVFTGLRTQVSLLSDLQGWLLCLLILAVATTGKLGGTAISARWMGMHWRQALQLGALMNTRGLMELIAFEHWLRSRNPVPTHFYDAGDYVARDHSFDSSAVEYVWKSAGRARTAGRNFDSLRWEFLF
jgi:Kef-type K+ transport system membrane component KefB